MKIAVIDSGLPKEYSPKNAYRIIIDKNLKAYLSKKEIYDENGHGTIVRKIIDNYLDNEDEVLTFKVLNKNLKGNSISLINAIEFCIENEVKIINISLGTVNKRFKKQLYNSIKKAKRHGTIIIAAEHNGSLISYPSGFKEVFGVRKLKLNSQNNRVSYNHSEVFFEVNINKIFPFKLIWSLKKIYYINGTSFLAPHITGIVSQVIKKKGIYNYEVIAKEVTKNFKNYYR